MCPFWLIIPSIIDFIHPLGELTGEWFCFLVQSLANFHFIVVMNQSFIIAMMRYWFIVQEERVKNYAKAKTKRIFVCLSIFIPLFMVIWATAENAELSPFLFVNRCYGRDHQVFLINISPLQVSNPYFCQFGNYSDKEIYGKIVEIFKRATCIFKTTLMFLMACNLTEGVIYYKIFSHMKRLVICI